MAKKPDARKPAHAEDVSSLPAAAPVAPPPVEPTPAPVAPVVEKPAPAPLNPADTIAPDLMTINAGGSPRPVITLKQGAEAPLTRALLARVCAFNPKTGDPLSNDCELPDRCTRLESMLSLWEQGVPY